MRGTTIILYEKEQTGTDPFGAPTYAETPVKVPNVLIQELQSESIPEQAENQSAKVSYMLAIPKGDKHDWRDKNVEFFGERFHTVGIPIKGITELIPLDWDQKVRVERYE